ncbi:hypothetical protein AYL99_11738 [Fonsecaea erecta]|uniref:Uncharacterized protein n=1 Tax=Fonsecaea erecta TaxID=1367422 RepID=A0A178Z4U1_9EURO|nr:hypothetical protein AYL99_11738 [Fonsecaea erecta]OAP54203.1 hypothetical protein AYL99_11738 [Fonsecaea erecta]
MALKKPTVKINRKPASKRTLAAGRRAALLSESVRRNSRRAITAAYRTTFDWIFEDDGVEKDAGQPLYSYDVDPHPCKHIMGHSSHRLFLLGTEPLHHALDSDLPLHWLPREIEGASTEPPAHVSFECPDCGVATYYCSAGSLKTLDVVLHLPQCLDHGLVDPFFCGDGTNDAAAVAQANVSACQSRLFKTSAVPTGPSAALVSQNFAKYARAADLGQPNSQSTHGVVVSPDA